MRGVDDELVRRGVEGRRSLESGLKVSSKRRHELDEDAEDGLLDGTYDVRTMRELDRRIGAISGKSGGAQHREESSRTHFRHTKAANDSVQTQNSLVDPVVELACRSASSDGLRVGRG